MNKTLKWILQNPMDAIAAIALSGSILITTMNAITRYTIQYTWNPGTDVVMLCFAYTVFCGSAAAYKRKMHYGIDLIVSALPACLERMVKMLCHLIMIVTLVFATYLSVDLMQHVGGKIMSNTKISYMWFDLSAVLGFAYMAVYEIAQTWEDFRKLKQDKEGKV